MTNLEYENLEIVSQAERYILWTSDLISPFVGKKVIEVGAGFGDLAGFLRYGREYTLTDIVPSCYGCKKLDITTQTESDTFNTIIASNVFEHLKVSDQAWKNVRKMLDKTGLFILIVPYGQKLYGSLDIAVGHYLRYEDWIVRKETPRGLKLIKTIKFNRLGSVGWWINCQLGKTEFNEKQIKFFDFLVPVLKKIDPFLPFPPLSAIYILERE